MSDENTPKTDDNATQQPPAAPATPAADVGHEPIEAPELTGDSEAAEIVPPAEVLHDIAAETPPPPAAADETTGQSHTEEIPAETAAERHHTGGRSARPARSQRSGCARATRSA